MSADNHSLVRTILNEIKKGLGPYIVETFAEHFGRERNAHLKSLKRALSSERAYRSMDFESDEDAKAKIDIAGWLKVMRLRWDTVFKEKLGEDVDSQDINVLNARSYLRELIEGRNKWGHETDENPISAQDVIRIAGTATRMLRAIGADKEANATHDLSVEFVQTNAETIAEGESETEDQIMRVDLSGLNLSDMDLRGRNLHLADLHGVDLSGSILQDGHLAGMDLSNARLINADLLDANLSDCNLSGADLSQARLEYANLRNSNLSRSKIAGASLLDAEMDYANFSYADLTGADMRISLPRDLDLQNPGEYSGDDWYNRLHKAIGRISMDMSHAILRQAKMQQLFLDNVNLSQADLTRANCTWSRLDSCELNGAILEMANLSNCELVFCDFSGAKMNGINLSGVSYCVHSSFVNAAMSGANLENFFIDESNIDEHYHWDGADLSEANLKGAILPGQSFRNANLTGAKFHGSDLSAADLSNADLNDTDFTGANLTHTDFTGAKFYPFSTIVPDGSYWDEDTDMTKFTGPAT